MKWDSISDVVLDYQYVLATARGGTRDRVATEMNIRHQAGRLALHAIVAATIGITAEHAPVRNVRTACHMKFRLGRARRGARAPTGGVVDCRAGQALRFPSCKNGSEKRSSIRRSAHAPSHRHKRGTTWSSSAFHALQIHYGQRPTSGAEPLSWVLPAGFVRRHCHRRIGGRPPCVKSNRTRSQERTRN